MATKKKESGLIVELLEFLNKHERSYCVKSHGDMYVRNLPDIVGSMAGLAIYVEAKEPGKHPTKMQAYILRKFADTGALSVCVHSVAELELCMNGVVVCTHCREILSDIDYQLGRLNCDRCRNEELAYKSE